MLTKDSSMYRLMLNGGGFFGILARLLGAGLLATGFLAEVGNGTCCTAGFALGFLVVGEGILFSGGFFIIKDCFD